VEVFKADKLHQVMDKFIRLSSPNVWNLVASFKYRLGNKRYVSSIFILKTNSGYCFIHESYFPRQHNEGESVYVQDVYAWKWFTQVDVAWGWPPHRLNHVWSCKACQRLDDTCMPCVWLFLLQGHDNCNMWYVIWKPRDSMGNVAESKQGHGK
jgi:hypothetical protein